MKVVAIHGHDHRVETILRIVTTVRTAEVVVVVVAAAVVVAVVAVGA